MRQIGRPSAIGFIAALLLFGSRGTKAQATVSPSSARGAILVKVADGSHHPLWVATSIYRFSTSTSRYPTAEHC
jgi:hypothetical protein